ncbi:MAG: 12-oxophytodienoate reductase [Bryobacterales bacterium]|nr:12-oxophytodienoate reductase [Bryobacterales bacterium]
MTRSAEALFRPFSIKGVTLPNRIVMAPMTRSLSPGGVPGDDVAAYYRRRAEGGVGLIITEGTYPPHPAAGFDPKVPRLYGEAALNGWRRVVEHVHAARGHIFSQLWHVGLQVSSGPPPPDGAHPVGPSGEHAMTQIDIDAAIQAYAQAAHSAQEIGFDGIELHGAHGYLIDQFFWEKTNQRTDHYGGDQVARTRFATEVIHEVRRRVGPDFPVVLRFSQWKIGDYNARLANTPDELEAFLRPLVDAGVDVFHCSTRRFWEPEFEGSDLNLAGWTKKLTGKPTITVGSVTLGADVMTSFASPDPVPATGEEGMIELLDRLERGEFDLVAVGRALIANPAWAVKVKAGAIDELRPFDRSLLASL